MAPPKERDQQQHSRDQHQQHGGGAPWRGLPPLLLGVLAAVYLVFAVALAHTAYIALQGRSAASEGLQASSQSASAFHELHAELSELRKQLAQAQAASSNASSTNLQELKSHVVQQLSRPLDSTSKATEQLLSKSAELDKRFQDLQQQLSALATKVQPPAQPPPQPPQPPAGVRVEDSELHHIATHGAVCDKRGAAGLSVNVSTGELVAPVVVVGHNRPGYLAKTMMTLLKYWTADPSYARKFPLFISIDGDDQRTLLLASALHQAAGVQVITRRRESGPNCPKADCHISQHYKLLLQLFLECHKAPGLMFVEEDLEIAPDFFSYFEATSRLMARDSSILCVSAWNDHGQRGRVKDHRALYRTDVMPGLGWYVNAAIGLELAPKWPFTNWDDWMRLASIRNGRSCIYPEVPRTHTFGRIGTHGEEGFDDHLSKMVLNDKPVAWQEEDLSYLLQANYAPMLTSWMDRAEVWNGTLEQLRSYCDVDLHPDEDDDEDRPGDLVYKYTRGKAGFEGTAKHLKPMKGDVREGLPRGSYNGHVLVRCRGRRLFLRAV